MDNGKDVFTGANRPRRETDHTPSPRTFSEDEAILSLPAGLCGVLLYWSLTAWWFRLTVGNSWPLVRLGLPVTVMEPWGLMDQAVVAPNSWPLVRLGLPVTVMEPYGLMGQAGVAPLVRLGLPVAAAWARARWWGWLQQVRWSGWPSQQQSALSLRTSRLAPSGSSSQCQGLLVQWRPAHCTTH
jgi:hypothetical protein